MDLGRVGARGEARTDSQKLISVDEFRIGNQCLLGSGPPIEPEAFLVADDGVQEDV